MDNREYRLLITLISCTMVIISRHFKKGSYMAQKWETQQFISTKTQDQLHFK